MGNLTRRYTTAEKARLVETMKPVERWTKFERQLWAEEQYGFRHFVAPNVTPIEHYRPPEFEPEPAGHFAIYERADFDPKPPPRRQTPPRSTPPRKPAA